MPCELHIHRHLDGKLAEALLHILTHKLDRIEQKQDCIMSAISDFADKVKTSYTAIGNAVDGLTGDIKTLNDKITALQNSAGAITPEDQAILDDIEAQAGAVAAKLSALDDLTAPAEVPTPA